PEITDGYEIQLHHALGHDQMTSPQGAKKASQRDLMRRPDSAEPLQHRTPKKNSRRGMIKMGHHR
ncbi:hypothetical protein, partial [Agrobacterium pusense]|uniref:hypothetical protein n=1 Tax=Agrobacterium pusense TaxID=648995 RepID=UPI001F1FA697